MVRRFIWTGIICVFVILPKQISGAGYLDDWTDWSPCSITCAATGSQTRTRKCIGGDDCVGNSFEAKVCDARSVSCPLSANTCGDVQNLMYNKMMNPNGMDMQCLMTKIWVNGHHECMGTIIGKATVLTLATCVTDENPDSYEVETLGCKDSASKTVNVKHINRDPSNCDIVVLTLKEALYSSGGPKPGKGGRPQQPYHIYLEIMLGRIPNYDALRIGPFSPPLLKKFCAINFMPSSGGITSYQKPGTYVDCSWDPMKSQVCLDAYWNIPEAQKTWVYGSPYLVASAGKLYLVGLLAGKTEKPYMDGIFNKVAMASIYECWQHVGCHLSGFWSNLRNNDSPLTGATDSEHWWQGTMACGGETPLCADHSFVSSTNAAWCPTVQNIRITPAGFECHNSDQPDGCKCNDYQVQFKCSYMIDPLGGQKSSSSGGMGGIGGNPFMAPPEGNFPGMDDLELTPAENEDFDFGNEGVGGFGDNGGGFGDNGGGFGDNGGGFGDNGGGFGDNGGGFGDTGGGFGDDGGGFGDFFPNTR